MSWFGSVALLVGLVWVCGWVGFAWGLVCELGLRVGCLWSVLWFSLVGWIGGWFVVGWVLFCFGAGGEPAAVEFFLFVCALGWESTEWL